MKWFSDVVCIRWIVHVLRVKCTCSAINFVYTIYSIWNLGRIVVQKKDSPLQANTDDVPVFRLFELIGHPHTSTSLRVQFSCRSTVKFHQAWNAPIPQLPCDIFDMLTFSQSLTLSISRWKVCFVWDTHSHRYYMHTHIPLPIFWTTKFTSLKAAKRAFTEYQIHIHKNIIWSDSCEISCTASVPTQFFKRISFLSCNLQYISIFSFILLSI